MDSVGTIGIDIHRVYRFRGLKGRLGSWSLTLPGACTVQTAVLNFAHAMQAFSDSQQSVRNASQAPSLGIEMY